MPDRRPVNEYCRTGVDVRRGGGRSGAVQRRRGEPRRRVLRHAPERLRRRPCVLTRPRRSRSTAAGKGATGWFDPSNATVYVDHPVHAQYAHTVNIDFINPELGPSVLAAVELTEGSALALVEAIQKAIASAPPGLASER